jgi:hypothetical protein
MRTRAVVAVVLTAMAATLSGRLAAAQGAERTPLPGAIIERACQAAGGWEAFQKLGIVKLGVKQEEITQEGKVEKTEMNYWVGLPGPVPGRLEIPASAVVAGDDGNGGWAIMRGRPDARPGTIVMIRRLIQSGVFAAVLPFSLKWDGVTVSDVQPAQSGTTQVWRMTVDFGRAFFWSPQSATRWTIDVDRSTWKILSAEAPATDLGQGVKADGLRFSWTKPVKVGAVTLNTEERVIGLDENGLEKSHTRNRTIVFETLPDEKAARLFGNPIPPDQRPRMPTGQMPTGPQGQPQPPVPPPSK